MSGVGMAGVLLTGVISIFVIGPEGRIHSATPWLFAGKEALIPLILAAAVVVSRSTGTPSSTCSSTRRSYSMCAG